MKRTIWISLGWILANASFVALLFGLEVTVNFFRWSPTWTLQSVACVSGLLVLNVLTYYLARITRDKSTLAVSLLACLGLLGIVLAAVAPELVTTGSFSRPPPSPDWYRWGRVMISSIPLVYWLIAAFRESELKDRA
jgi:hypothetical protein